MAEARKFGGSLRLDEGVRWYDIGSLINEALTEINEYAVIQGGYGLDWSTLEFSTEEQVVEDVTFADVVAKRIRSSVVTISVWGAKPDDE